MLLPMFEFLLVVNVYLGWCLLFLLFIRSVHLEILGFPMGCAYRLQRYFCGAQNYAEKAEPSKCSWYPKRKLGVTMHFSEIIELQFGKERHTLLCILKLFTNIVDYYLRRMRI